MPKSDLFSDIYEVVKLIPKGRVSTYGAVANYIGLKSGARMVGWAMNAAHTDPSIPAHRVLNRNGQLTGKAHFTSPTKMEELLKAEGVKVQNDLAIDFEEIFWDPTQHLL